VWMSHIQNLRGQYEETLAIARKRSDLSNLRPDIAYALAKSGRRAEAQEVLNQWREVGKTKFVSHYWMAVSEIALGNKEGAFAELEEASRQHEWFFQRIKVDPFMDPLRDDPRFASLVKRLKFPE